MYTVVLLDDWEGLYDPDGKLLNQNHRLSIRDIFKALNIELKVVSAELDEGEGSLPDNLQDVTRRQYGDI